jgi:predicted HAD superfamily hydrolase
MKIGQRNDILDLLANYEIVSFDIFDTVLLRRVKRPYGVFFQAGLFFAVNRIVAERIVRVFMRLRRVNEVTLSEIYSLIPFHDLESEIDLELTNLFVDAHALEIINLCQALEKIVYFVSDMYLGKIDLENLLIKNGISQPFQILVSSDYRLPKSKGLFGILIDRSKPIHPHNILHIGDNWNSDIVASKHFGIHSYYVGK